MYYDIPDEPELSYVAKRVTGGWAVFHPETPRNNPKWGMGILYPNRKEAERVAERLCQRALRAG